MSGDAPQKPEGQKLSIKDPVSQEVLARLNELDTAKAGLARQNLMLDEEKVKLLGASRRIAAENQELFNKILTDRGIPPGTPVNIDPKSGEIRLQELVEGEGA